MRISDWSSDVCSSDLNPARWKGNLIHLLPRRKNKKQVRHHPAIPYEEMPDFMRQLRGRAAIAARALELTVLCATRTTETRPEARRLGKRWIRTSKAWWTPQH